MYLGTGRAGLEDGLYIHKAERGWIDVVDAGAKRATSILTTTSMGI